MLSTLLDFASRFRRKPTHDPIQPRTMADSENQDLQNQKSDSEERRKFDERAFEQRQDALHHNFGTSSHGGDNPTRENDLKNQH